MQYISPFHIIDYESNKNDLEKGNVSKLKRKVLAKFEFNNHEPIEVGAQIINKSDALALVEELQDKAILEYHTHVYMDKSLLAFLENGEHSFLLASTSFTPSFKEWVSPYFAFQFGKQYYDSIDDRPILTFLSSIDLQDFITDKDIKVAYASTLDHLRRYAKPVFDLPNCPETILLDRSTQACEVFSISFLHLLRVLPPYFDDFKHTLAIVCNDLKERIEEELSAFRLAFKFREFANAIFHHDVKLTIEKEIEEKKQKQEKQEQDEKEQNTQQQTNVPPHSNTKDKKTNPNEQLTTRQVALVLIFAAIGYMSLLNRRFIIVGILLGIIIALKSLIKPNKK